MTPCPAFPNLTRFRRVGPSTLRIEEVFLDGWSVRLRQQLHVLFLLLDTSVQSPQLVGGRAPRFCNTFPPWRQRVVLCHHQCQLIGERMSSVSSSSCSSSSPVSSSFLIVSLSRTCCNHPMSHVCIVFSHARAQTVETVWFKCEGQVERHQAPSLPTRHRCETGFLDVGSNRHSTPSA